MKKRFFTLVVIIFILLGILYCNYIIKKYRAINISEEYLLQKYNFEPIYHNCKFSVFEPKQYFITFSFNELLFQVIVPSNLKMPNDSIRNNDIYVSDNYTLNRFKFLIIDYLNNKTRGKFNGFIVLKNQPIYYFKISKNVKLNMDLFSLEKEMNYDLYINFKNNKNLVEVSKYAYDYISIVKESGFTPKNIIICMENNNGTNFVTIDKWSEIGSYNEILLQIK